MDEPKVKIPREKLYEKYIAEVERFWKPEMEKRFKEVIAARVTRGRLKKGAVKVSKTSPWLHLKDSSNFMGLLTAFEDYTEHKFPPQLVRDREMPRSEFLRLHGERQRAVLIEEKVWGVVVLSLLLKHGATDEDLSMLELVIREWLSYLAGAHYMDDFGNLDMARLAEHVTHDEVLAKARSKRLEPIQKYKTEFFAWAKVRLLSGDNPATLEEVMGLAGFKPEWSRKNEKTLRQISREAGFKLKRGRPKK